MHIQLGSGNANRVVETLRALDRDEEPAPFLERVDRDVQPVHRSLEKLAELDRIGFEGDGAGKPRRPSV